ncbi:MAG: hypothetical protein ACREJ3_11260 [Polyangiaceae bacterium]
MALGVALGASLQAACVTAPPPDLPVAPKHRPTILHDSLVPPANTPILQGTWPADDTFLVPIELDDPGESYCFQVFEDYEPYAAGGQATTPVRQACATPPPSAIDGGITIVSFTLSPSDPPLDLGQCHRVEIVVANTFRSVHTPDAIGGDSVTWIFVPGTGPGCPVVDAGAFEDGGIPNGDAFAGAVLVTPDSAGIP